MGALKPSRFTYHDPATLAEALALLCEYGDDAKVLAGGQSLMPLLNMRLARPARLVDINRLSELAYIREEPEIVRIGALTRHRQVEQSPLLAQACPLLPAAARHVAHFQIRNRGTLGGSLVHNDPSAEMPLVATTLDAQFVVHSQAGGERVLAPDAFFLTYLTTLIGPDELLVEVRYPRLPVHAGWSFQEVARRRGDFALVAAAVVLEVQDQICIRARIGLGGVGPIAQRAPEAEASLIGQPLTAKRLREAAALAAQALDPDSDIHASSAFRRQLAETLVARGLAEALTRAGGRTSQ